MPPIRTAGRTRIATGMECGIRIGTFITGRRTAKPRHFD
jgi:hypothetical protein